MRIQHALARYLTQLRANGRSEHTVLQSQRHIRLLDTWLSFESRSLELGAVTEDTLAEFLISDLATKMKGGAKKSPGTMNALRCSLKTFFGHATRAGWVPHNPSQLIRRAVCSPPPPRWLTPDEATKFLAALEEGDSHEAKRDAMLFRFMLATGVRLSSALAIETGDIDVEERTVLLRTMKGRDVQRVYMPDKTANELAQFIGERKSGAVFARQDGRRLSARHAQRRFRFWREKAGIQEAVTPHSLRHAFAERLYQRTGDVLLVRSALGHRSISSTLVYTHADTESLQRALA